MRAQGSGRIINISSIGAKMYEPLGAWYHATKFAVEGLSDSLRMELKPHGIKVAIIEPAGTVSEWGSIAAHVAEAILHAATARRPKTRYLVGASAKGILLLRHLLPDRAFDARLWNAYKRLPR